MPFVYLWLIFCFLILYLFCLGVFFTLGSYVYIRAFEDPPRKPLFPKYYHICTDELLGSWLYTLAVLPSIPLSLLFIYYRPYRFAYWGYLITSLITVGSTLGFVRNCYPQDISVQKEEARYVLNFAKSYLGENHWILRHVANDWLASCWVFFWGGLLSTVLCYLALFFQTANDRQLYVWVTSFVNSAMFLIGSAYFVAGSYPRDETLEMLELDDLKEESLTQDLHKKTNGNTTVYNPIINELP